MKKIITILLSLTLLIGAAIPFSASAQTISSTNLSNLVRLFASANLSNQVKLDLIALVIDRFGNKNNTVEAEQEQAEAETEAEIDDEEDIKRPQANEVSVIDNSRHKDDRAEFELVFSLNAFGSDIYIDQDLQTSFDFEILDQNDNVVADESDLSGANLAGIVSSKVQTQDKYYVFNKNERTQVTVKVNFNPDVANFYRLRLTDLNYNDNPNSPDQKTSLSERYFTSNPIYVSSY